MKKVSVIVAIYGVEYWIEESLSSLLSQSLPPEQLELILVNDASPDDSMEIARRLVETKFPERIPYVKFIEHQFNMGVSRTRRDGILAATGDYIIHFDPDDLLHPQAYELMLAEAERADADVTLCDFLYVDGNRRSKLAQRPNEMTARCLMEQICGARIPTLHGSMCNKLIRSELYEKVKLPDRINFCEDAMTVCSMLCLPDVTIASTDLPLYTYRFREGSMVGTPNYEGDIRLYKELAKRAGEARETWQRDAFSAFISSLLYHRSYIDFRGTAEEFARRFGRFSIYVDFAANVPKRQKKHLRQALEGKHLQSKLRRHISYAINRRLANLRKKRHRL